MTFVAIFLVNAALSFALSLVVAQLVGPEAFGRYALALAISVVINTALFEWLRLSTTRFYSERVRRDEPQVETSLNRAYFATTALVLTSTVLLLVLGLDFGLSPGLLGAGAALGVSVGIFDYRTAQARARFLDRRYAALLIGRGTLAFAAATGAAWFWADPILVLHGSALAAVATLVLVRDRGAPPARANLDRALLRRFARYAVPLVAATAVYQLLPLINRAVLAGRSGFAEAGYFSLASEIATRLFQNLGSALDLALFQVAVRAEERDGAEAGERQIARNIAIIVALTCPATVGLCAVWPSFEALFVPAAFRGHVSSAMMLAVPTFAAYALVQYALNPLFQIRKRTGPVIAAAVVALAVNAGLLLIPGAAGTTNLAAIQLAGFAAGLLAMVALAIMARAALPWRDIALSAGAAALMGAALWPWRTMLPPVPGLISQVACGGAIYAALALALNIAGARSVAWSLAARVRPESFR